MIQDFCKMHKYAKRSQDKVTGSELKSMGLYIPDGISICWIRQQGLTQITFVSVKNPWERKREI